MNRIYKIFHDEYFSDMVKEKIFCSDCCGKYRELNWWFLIELSNNVFSKQNGPMNYFGVMGYFLGFGFLLFNICI